MSWTNESKNTSTFYNKLRKGKMPSMETLSSYTFEDELFKDNKKLKDYTFADFGTTEWTNESKTLREAGFDESFFDASVFNDEGGYDNIWFTEERN